LLPLLARGGHTTQDLLLLFASHPGAPDGFAPYRIAAGSIVVSLWIGPWPWMLFAYKVMESDDIVAVVTVRDARSSSSPTMPRSRP